MPVCRGLTSERSKEAGREWRESEAAQSALKLAIEQVLRLIYEEHYEVPFIASYRKEVCSIAVNTIAFCCMHEFLANYLPRVLLQYISLAKAIQNLWRRSALEQTQSACNTHTSGSLNVEWLLAELWGVAGVPF